jgi:hypothetical protein
METKKSNDDRPPLDIDGKTFKEYQSICGDTHITLYLLPQSIGSILLSMGPQHSLSLCCSASLSCNRSAALHRATNSISLSPYISVLNSTGKPRPPVRTTSQWRSRPLSRIAYKRDTFPSTYIAVEDDKTGDESSYSVSPPGHTGGNCSLRL